MKLKINFTKESTDYWEAECFGCRASGHSPLHALKMLIDVMEGTERLYNKTHKLGPHPLRTKQLFEKFRKGKL